MTITNADRFTNQTDLLLADGSVIYIDGFSCWWRVDPTGNEHRLGSRFDVDPCELGTFDNGSHWNLY